MCLKSWIVGLTVLTMTVVPRFKLFKFEDFEYMRSESLNITLAAGSDPDTVAQQFVKIENSLFQRLNTSLGNYISNCQVTVITFFN